MVVGEDPAEAGVLPKETRRRGQGAIVHGAASLSILWATGPGTVATLFILSLGAQPFHIGLLGTMTQMVMLGQIGGLSAIPRVGKGRLVALGRLATALPLCVLVGLAASGKAGPGPMCLAMASVTMVMGIFAVSHAGWWPLLKDNTDGDLLGAFLARLRTRLRIVEIALPMLVGWFLGQDPPRQRFALPFGIAALAMVYGGWMMRNIGEKPAIASDSKLVSRLMKVGRVRSVQQYALFVGARTFGLTLATTFWVVMLKAQGMPASYTVWLGALAAFGNVCGLRMWARLVDRHGSRAVLTITGVPEGLLGLAWVLMPRAGEGLLPWAICFYLLWGLLEGGFFMGQTPAMMKAMPRENQAEGFALANYIGSLSGMMGCFLGGVVFQWASSHTGVVPGFDARLLFLAAAQLFQVVVWRRSTYLAGYPEETPTRVLIGNALRRVTSRGKA